MKKIYSFLLVLLFAFILVGCGEKVTISINDADKAITLEEGKIQKVTPTVSSAEAILEWNSSDETVAKVSDGTIEAVKPGEAIITVSVKDEKDTKATITVTVTKKIIYEVNVENKDLSVLVGTEFTIVPTYTENTSLKWETSDETVVTVIDGKVKALKAGAASIKVSIVDHPEAYTRVNVTVINPLVVADEEVSIDEGASTTVTVVKDEGVTLVWESSDPEVATVVDGVINGLKVGEATLTVKIEGLEESKVEIKVVVNKVLADSVTINYTNNKLVVGDTEQLSATIAPVGAEQDVEWSSSDSEVATISSEGLVTALKAGTTTIKAMAKDGSEKYYEYELIVYNAVADFEISGKNTMKYTETQTLELTIKTENTLEKFAWSSSNEAVASVDQNGLVTALDEGTVTIKAVAQDSGKLEKTFEITITREKVKIGSTEYKTLSAALEAAKEGDTIVVPAGNYSEELSITKNNITFKGPNVGVKGDENRVAEASITERITIKANVNGFKVDGFRFTDKGQLLLEDGVSNVVFQYNVMDSLDGRMINDVFVVDGVVRGPAKGTVSNIVMNYNYSEAYNVNRFLHITETIDNLEMIGNYIKCSSSYDFINVGSANGVLKGKVVIQDNTYINSQQSFLFIGGVGVLDCSIKGNYVEDIQNTVVDLRDMREDGLVKIVVEENEFKNSGQGWGAIRVRSVGYDEKDSIEVLIKNNKFFEIHSTDTPRFFNNPNFSSTGDAPFDKIYTIGRNYYEVNGSAYTDLKDDCFGGAAISYENAYATAEEVPGF